uniref:Uncharacterized protein n=1 Tax=Romanomermis culicivorax TaxID=13658 RepID=A0A915KFH4_ROMCU
MKVFFMLPILEATWTHLGCKFLRVTFAWKSIVQMIAVDDQPITVVKTPGFISSIKKVAWDNE